MPDRLIALIVSYQVSRRFAKVGKVLRLDFAVL